MGYVNVIMRFVVGCFGIDRQSLQQSCARSVKELYQHVLVGEKIEKKNALVYRPLLEELRAGGATVQSTGSLAVYELLLFMLQENLYEDFHALAENVLYTIHVRPGNEGGEDRVRGDSGPSYSGVL